MHQIFRLEELVRNISYCAESTRQGSASLLAFACCCKLLEGPVMDVLWERQTDLYTILKTLPKDSWTDTPGFSERTLSLSRNISEDEWQRFRRYAARVVSLGVSNVPILALFSQPNKVSVETIQLLGMESQRGAFWPRLRSLRCNIGWDITPFISLFLTPTITSLSLTLPRENNRLLQPTLSLLTHTCRRLQSLSLDVCTSGPLSAGEMGRLVSTSRNALRHIDIKTSIPLEVFPTISDLPQLRGLTLKDSHFPDQISPEILPCLETIILSGSHGSNLNLFLGRLTSQRLTCVSIVGGEIIQLSQSLDSLRGAATTMRTLNISPATTFDHSCVILLHSFSNLTYLTIRCICDNRQLGRSCSFQPTDDNISELGEALPHIRHLTLGSESCNLPCLATFASLLCVSRKCRGLEYIAIRIDFTSIVDGSGQLGQLSTRANGSRRRRNGRSIYINVGNSPLPDIPHCEWVVALALVSTFTSIKSLSHSCIGEMNTRWGEVRQDLPICRRILDVTQTAA